MLAHYFKIALRHIRNQKGYTFINVTGLAVGLACCLLIGLYVLQETSYDTYHLNKDRVYRLVGNYDTGSLTTNFALTSGPAAPALEAAFPEVEQAVRFFNPGVLGNPVVRTGDRQFTEDDFFFVSPEVFDLFTLPFIEGDPGTALTEPLTLVLTASTARKYFGDQDALGRTLTVADTLEFRVTGVMEDLPQNTHLDFDFLAPMQTALQILPDLSHHWGATLLHTYVLLAEGADSETLSAKFPEFVEAQVPDHYYKRTLGLEALPRIHLYSGRPGGMKPAGSILYVMIFSAIGLFILLIACINFMNLTTARATNRAREIGMRKALGAQRVQLVRQFLGESLFMAGMALILTLVLAVLCLPLFNTLTGQQWTVDQLTQLPVLAGLFGLALLAGLGAGAYPALVLSSFRPLDVFKGDEKGRRRGAGLKKGLVVVQFTFSTALMICTAVVYLQLDYVRNTPLGFNQDHVVVMPIGVDPVGENIDVFKQSLRERPEVLDVTVSMGVPGYGLIGVEYWVEGLPREEFIGATTFLIDHDYVETFGLEMIAGRDFDPARDQDHTQGYLINETAARTFGWDEPLGKRMSLLMFNEGAPKPDGEGEVIGVIKDFHYSGLKTEINPAVFRLSSGWQQFNTVSARIRPERVPETMAFLETTWQAFAPTRPFNSFFLEDNFNQQYRNEDQLGKLFLYFAGLAIIIACLGLFGLAAFTAQQRTKEIGIRKVLGASVSGIVLRLSRGFVGLVLIAFAIAAPVAYFAMQKWLEEFAYGIEISGWIFLVSGLAALLVAVLTVGYQSIKAALANPVDTLRYE